MTNHAELGTNLETIAVSVVLPVYNEEEGLALVLDQLYDILPRCGLSELEIIVVDDGSDDETSKIAGSYNEIDLIRHNVNRGYGAALKTGIYNARYDLIVITDADGTYPNERITDMIARMVEGNYDMVVGSRIGADVTIPILRQPAKWAIRLLAKYVTGEPIPDLNSGMRIFRRDIAKRFASILPQGFSFTTTITLAMLANGYRVDYLPIDYYKRIGRSKIRPVQDTLNFFGLVTRIALYFYPLKMFLPMSVSLLGLAFIWALLSHYVFGRLADVSTLILVISSIQIGAIGLLAELINKRLPNYFREE